ncbi:hypothetical protein HK100_012672 [Physocladia obscura]|uniref:SH3 domain-containing protein n=1 Tax=Physocladia obscura TaxID=109957 RepID=A0AAD5T876_9FUNG|nr:hypothetical protein HK100_012672 [Physocladia obscura]
MPNAEVAVITKELINTAIADKSGSGTSTTAVRSESGMADWYVVAEHDPSNKLNELKQRQQKQILACEKSIGSNSSNSGISESLKHDYIEIYEKYAASMLTISDATDDTNLGEDSIIINVDNDSDNDNDDLRSVILSSESLKSTEQQQQERQPQPLLLTTHAFIGGGGGQNQQVAATHISTGQFFARRSDEMGIGAGDLIAVVEGYTDGWVRAMNLSQGRKMGVVPGGVLRAIYNRIGPSKRAVRVIVGDGDDLGVCKEENGNSGTKIETWNGSSSSSAGCEAKSLKKVDVVWAAALSNQKRTSHDSLRYRRNSSNNNGTYNSSDLFEFEAAIFENGWEDTSGSEASAPGWGISRTGISRARASGTYGSAGDNES